MRNQLQSIGISAAEPRPKPTERPAKSPQKLQTAAEKPTTSVKEKPPRQNSSLANQNPSNKSKYDWPKWKPVPYETNTDATNIKLNAQDLYELVKPNIWVVYAFPKKPDAPGKTKIKQGSAVAISKTNLLTNCHVLKESVLIVLSNEKVRTRAKLTSADPSTDRCVLQVEDYALTSVRGFRRFKDLKVGEKTYSVGAPEGLGWTLGEGLISGLRTQNSLNVIQTSAPITFGSSGGGLFDTYGNLIGITTRGITSGALLNFAIAAEEYWAEASK